MNISVDIKNLSGLSKKLKSLNKSAFPIAIRKTLNDEAYDLKQNTMPKKASNAFKKRQPNFFKANSKIIQAKGFDVRIMNSEVGFFSNNLKGNNNAAVKDLEEQEGGGTINKKTFIAKDGARKSDSALGLIKPNRYLKKLPNLQNKVAVTNNYGRFNGKLHRIKSAKQKFIRAAFAAKKKYGGFILGNKFNGGTRTLSIINSISSNGDQVKIKRTPLYSVKNNRRVKVNAKNFMKRASYETALSVNAMFIKNAQERFLKHLRNS